MQRADTDLLRLLMQLWKRSLQLHFQPDIYLHCSLVCHECNQR